MQNLSSLIPLGLVFRNFKCRLYKKCHLDGKTPNFNEYAKLNLFGRHSYSTKIQEEERNISKGNKNNAKMNLYSHRMVSRGNVRKEDEFHKMEEKQICMGAIPVTRVVFYHKRVWEAPVVHALLTQLKNKNYNNPRREKQQQMRKIDEKKTIYLYIQVQEAEKRGSLVLSHPTSYRLANWPP
jgi:hypothetical protein